MAKTVMETVRCRQCGFHAETGAWGQEYCWLCTARLESPAQAGLLAPPTAQRQAGRTFGLSTLMVMVALCAVFFGVFRESPGLGILLAIVLTPALGATFVKVMKREARGRPMTVLEKFGTFAASAGIVVGTIVVLCVAAVVLLRAICSQLGL